MSSPSTALAAALVNNSSNTSHDIRVAIWTTTPWTIPANLAVAVNPDIDYCLASHPNAANNAHFIVAKDLGIPVEIRRFSVVELQESLNNNTLTEAFGVGTAATIKPMSEIGINGKRYPLNNPDNWKIVPWLLRELDGIRRGSIDDRFNWNIPV